MRHTRKRRRHNRVKTVHNRRNKTVHAYRKRKVNKLFSIRNPEKIRIQQILINPTKKLFGNMIPGLRKSM
jgi:hypothetical protein